MSLIISSLKTGGKHLLGTTLLTQSASDLGQHAELITNTCPMQLFLADDKFNRKPYTDLFQLNSRELEVIASLQQSAGSVPSHAGPEDLEGLGSEPGTEGVLAVYDRTERAKRTGGCD